MRFTTSEIATATGGELFGRDVQVLGANIDSRTIARDQLFVPIVAERDGHDFIGAAVGQGATAYLTSGPIEAATAIRVADTATALTDLGRLARSRLHGPVIGITGSVGKTSVKDLMASAMATTFRTSAAVGSFNNEMGVPLTLANAPDDTEVAVIEMGARGRGHIAWLCDIARPTIGVVTVVAGAHLELFRTLDEVAAAKAELVAALSADGTAILNDDDDRVAAMAAVASGRVLTFGVDGGDVQAERIRLDHDLRASFTLRSDWGSAEVHLAVAGYHQVTNALGAAAAALVCDVPVEGVATGLGQAHLSVMRMDLVTLPSGARLLDDSYNANVTSMLAALDALAALPASRRLAVLGTMAELGGGSDAAHREVAEAAAARGLEVLSIGEPAYGDARPGLTVALDVTEALHHLEERNLTEGDAVLVKASRAARLERVVEALRPEAQ